MKRSNMPSVTQTGSRPPLDAPVSGGTRGAAAGELAIMAGGKGETFAAMQLSLLRHSGPTSAMAGKCWPSWPIRSSSPSPSVP